MNLQDKQGRAAAVQDEFHEKKRSCIAYPLFMFEYLPNLCKGKSDAQEQLL